MRAIILLALALVAFAADESTDVPKKVTAEESAKIMAELKAKKVAAAAAKDPEQAKAEAEKRENGLQQLAARKEEDAEAARMAGLRRRAETCEKDARNMAKKAYADGEQFRKRAAAEKKGQKGYELYREKITLHETGATNATVLEDVDKTIELVAKCNDARIAAGLDPLPVGSDRPHQKDVVDWIVELGRR